jgi:glycosyltransferase involved in cell wall biosynthesis
VNISVIIPTYNIEAYVESTILSLIYQLDDTDELIIIDGGSSDRTIDIIRKYENYLTYFISESDNGMYYAINKGLEIAKGEIISWLNADDIYFPWTLSTVKNVFTYNKEIKWLAGIPSFLNEDGTLKLISNSISAKNQKAIRNGWYRQDVYGYLQQESMFWRKEVMVTAGKLNLKYKLASDFELWTRFANYAELWTINLPLAAFRIRESSQSKKLVDIYIDEVKSVVKNFKKAPIIYRVFGKYRYINKLLRLLTFYKTKIIFFSFNSCKMLFSSQKKSVSSYTISQLKLLSK